MDDDTTITRLQSATFRAAMRGLIANALAITAIVSGKTFDITLINQWVDFGLMLLPMAYSAWEFKNAMKGRLKADKKIQPLPWREEIKSLKKEP